MLELDWLLAELPAEGRDQLREARHLTEAWRACRRADWLVRLALAARADRRTVVGATAELVTAAVNGLPRGAARDLRVYRALVTARGWVDGKRTAKEAWAEAFGANEAAAAMDGAGVAVARAVACLALGCDEEADDVFYLHRGYPVKAAAHASIALGDASRAADQIRAEIPLAAFLEAVERRRRARAAAPAPPPPPETTDSFYC